MTGKGGKYRFLILVITAFAVAGCYMPVGSIGQGQSAPKASGYDGFLVEFKKVYAEDEPFLRGDVEVYTITRDGEKTPIIPDSIKVIEDPADPGNFTVVPEGGYTFASQGIKDIMVEYNGYSFKYSIEVKPAGSVDGGQASGIQIIWVY
jgi:hypothetical protein